MAAKLFFRRTALKQLRALDRSVTDRILAKLEWIAAQDDPLRFAQSLTSAKIGTHRFRVGDWRVIVIADQQEITLVDVGHRREIYR